MRETLTEGLLEEKRDRGACVRGGGGLLQRRERRGLLKELGQGLLDPLRAYDEHGVC